MDLADYRLLRQSGKDLVELGEANGDPVVIAWGDYYGGIALIYNNEGGAATRALRRALATFRANALEVAAARTMVNLAMIEADINLNSSEARRLYEEAAPVLREDGDVKRLAILHGNLGEIYRLEGDYAAALRYGNDSARGFAETSDWGRLVWQLVDIAHYHCLRREYAEAIATMRSAYEPLSKEWNPRWIAWYFDVWVIIAAKLERWETAAKLLGFVDKLRSEQNVPRLQLLLPWLSGPMERFASVLTQDRLHELFLEGEALTTQTANDLASTIAV